MKDAPFEKELRELILSSPQPALGVRQGRIALQNARSHELFGNVSGLPALAVVGESLSAALVSLIAEGGHFRAARAAMRAGAFRVQMMALEGDAALLFFPEEEGGQLPAFMLNMDIQLRSRISLLLPALEIIRAEMSGGKTEQAERYLSEARRSVLSLLRMSNNVRDMAHCIERNDFADTSNHDLAGLCASVIELSSALAVYKNVTIGLDCEERPLVIRLDYEKIERVLYNILSNAVLHSYDGGRVAVSIARSNGQAVISVRDFGEGISPGRLARIYDGFKTGPDRSGGIGIGLPLSNEFVRMHGGTLLLESVEGAGTAVTIALPDRVDDGHDGVDDFAADYTGHYPHHLVELADFPAYNPAYTPAKPCDGGDIEQDG